jgi:hypothetical protein
MGEQDGCALARSWVWVGWEGRVPKVAQRSPDEISAIAFEKGTSIKEEFRFG